MSNKRFGTFDASTNTSDIRLANGTTAQRPGTPLSAQARFNSDFNRLEFYDGTAWAAGSSVFKRVRATETLAFVVDRSFDSTLTKLNSATPVTFTTVLAASDFEDGFKFSVENIGTDAWTFNPQGAETINGQTTMQVPSGYFATFYCDGSNWYVTIARQNSTGNSVRDFFTAGGDPALIENLSGESGTSGWSLYNDNSFYVTDGTGGVVTAGFTWTTTALSPISGTQSFLLTKPAALCFGQGVSYDFQISGNFRDTIWSIDLSFKYVTGIERLDNVRIFIYDVDNAQYLQPSPHELIQTAPDGQVSFYSGSFVATTATNYRLCIHCTARHADAFSLQIDDIVIRQGAQKLLNKYADNFAAVGMGQPFERRSSDNLAVSTADRTGNIVYANRVAKPFYAILNGASINIMSMNTATLSWEVGTSTATAAASLPGGIYCPINNVIYFLTAGTPATIKRYDVTANNWLADLTIAGQTLGANGVQGCYVPSVNGIYFTTTGGGNLNLQALNCATNTFTVAATIAGATQGLSAIYISSTDRVMFTSGAATNVYVANPQTNTLVATIATAAPQTARSTIWSEKANLIFAGAGRVINPNTNTVVYTNVWTTDPALQGHVGYSPFTNQIIAADITAAAAKFICRVNLSASNYSFVSSNLIPSNLSNRAVCSASSYIPQLGMSGGPLAILFR